jgi:tyrosyl-tRNA synthetase
VGTSVLVLIANFHGYLDARKTEWSSIEERTREYRDVLARAGIDDVHETADFYMSGEYFRALVELSAGLPLRDVVEAGAGTLATPVNDASVADALYVATQVLDAAFLDVDGLICGMDESPIYRFGLPLLASRTARSYEGLFLPMCPGLTKAEMHASDDTANKLLLFEPQESMRPKLSAYVARFDSELGSPLGEYLQTVVAPLAGIQIEAGRGDGSALLAALLEVQSVLTSR